MKETFTCSLLQKGVRLSLSLALVFSMCLMLPRSAGAAEMVELTLTKWYRYGGVASQIMYADGNIAYCADSRKRAPEGGEYKKFPLSTTSGQDDEARAALWFSYGAPGFDPSMWPSVWQGEKPMTEGYYYAASHIVISDIFWADSGNPLDACTEEFASWGLRELLGYDENGSVVNENASAQLIRARMDEVPDEFQVFMFNQETDTQVIVGFTFPQPPESNPPAIRTTAYDASDGDKFLQASQNVSVSDVVSYENLEPGVEYRLVGKLMSKASGQAIVDPDGESVTSAVNFVPSEASGEVEVEFSFDAGLLAGQDLVVFEALYSGDSEIASHADLSDEGQTVRVAGLRTRASDALDGDKLVSGYEASLVDAVSYDGLTPGQEYRLEGRLVDSVTGGEVDRESVSFTPDASSGTQTMKFSFNADACAGHRLVVFERLYRGDKLIASHEDLSDLGQSVYPVSIGTTLVDAADGDHVVSGNEVELVDQVRYEGLTPGKEYRLEGRLVFKGSGDAVVGEDGDAVVAEALFVPGSESGVAEVRFFFRTGSLVGSDLVALETLYSEGVEVAAHADLSDEGQTVRVVGLGTYASDALDGDKVISGESVTLTDRVRYDGLVPGIEYQLYGRVIDSVTGEEIVLDGKAQDCVTLIPSEPSGIQDVDFTFDASSYAGHRLVVFERLYRGDKLIASHEDLSDLGQSVYPVSIGTTLVDAADGDHVASGGRVELVDQVRYEGLTPGKEYRLEGRLVFKGSGDAVVGEDGDAVVAEALFVPGSESGVAEVAFSFDAAPFAGREVVAFEALYSEGVELAVHADLSDEKQTVRVVGLRTTAADAHDGDKMISGSEAVVVDRVEYCGLIPGKEYELSGCIMDSVTGEEVPLAEESFGSIAFVPTEPEGSIEVEFPLNASQLAGHRLVAFERLLLRGSLVASHEDLSDLGQSVYPVSIGTTLVDATDGDHLVTGDTVMLVDIVEYSGLIAGETYQLNGSLVNKLDGTVVADSFDIPLVAQTSFVAEETEGFVEVAFFFDASTIQEDIDLVAFEDCLDTNGRLIASHRDLSSDSQTVTFVVPDRPDQPDVPDEPTSQTPQTMDDLSMPIALLCGFAVLAFIALLWSKRRGLTR